MKIKDAIGTKLKEEKFFFDLFDFPCLWQKHLHLFCTLAHLNVCVIVHTDDNTTNVNNNNLAGKDILFFNSPFSFFVSRSLFIGYHASAPPPYQFFILPVKKENIIIENDNFSPNHDAPKEDNIKKRGYSYAVDVESNINVPKQKNHQQPALKQEGTTQKRIILENSKIDSNAIFVDDEREKEIAGVIDDVCCACGKKFNDHGESICSRCGEERYYSF